jgi:hypothetical protein
LRAILVRHATTDLVAGRVDVAPMMDWSDGVRSASDVKQLRNLKSACPHSVSTLYRYFEELQIDLRR